MILTGIEKSAFLLMSIGPDQAGKILKCLSFLEVQKLITAMININQCSTQTLHELLYECYTHAYEINTISCNSNEYLSAMLTRALGEKKGSSLLQDVLEIRNTEVYIEALNFMEPNQVAVLLSKEHPQIITTILVHLEKQQTAQILTFLDDKQRSEIILRIAEFQGIEESNLLELRKVINNLFKNKKFVLSDKGGIKNAASILNFMQLQFEKNTLKNMYEYNENLASKIVQSMQSFENILNLQDSYIKLLVKNIDNEKLYIALQGTSHSIKEKFFKNMPEKAAYELCLSLKKPSCISNIAIKNEQQLILMIAKNILEKNVTCIRKKNV